MRLYMKDNCLLDFSNSIKKLKNDFKKMIDEMPDKEFIDMISFLLLDPDKFEGDWDFDEGWEDEAEKFYSKGIKNTEEFDLTKNDNIPF